MASAHEAGALSTPTGHLQKEESMATLADEIKEFIVKSLARYETPQQVAERVRETFDIKLERQQIHAYDPACLRPPAQRWRDLHAATREAHLREVAEIGISQKAVRLAMLDRMARSTMENNRFERAAALLEQAAKECGGIYENRKAIVLQVPLTRTSVSQTAVSQPSVPPPSVRPPSLSPNRPGGTIEAVPLRQLPDLRR
jgi:hypothetical protein